MKSNRTRTILSAWLTAAILFVLFFGASFAVGRMAFAETAGDNYALGKFEGINYIYSANLSIENDGDEAGLVFGADDDLTSFFVAAVDASQSKVILGQSGT